MKPVESGTIFVLLCFTLLGHVALASEYCDWKEKDLAISDPLCELKGDAKQGRQLSLERKKGNCLACHQMPIPEEDFHGTFGPSLEGVGSRYKEGELRLRLVDMKQINPMTVMPSFYKHPDKFHRVAKKFQGKTPLTAQEIEDVVAYLITLK